MSVDSQEPFSKLPGDFPQEKILEEALVLVAGANALYGEIVDFVDTAKPGESTIEHVRNHMESFFNERYGPSLSGDRFSIERAEATCSFLTDTGVVQRSEDGNFSIAVEARKYWPRYKFWRAFMTRKPGDPMPVSPFSEENS